jgi:uncharacterized damage-inducible protein DinB
MTPAEQQAGSMETTLQRASATQRLLRLVDQSLWANRLWVDFVYSLPHPEVRPRELLSHILLGERAWFQRVADQPELTDTFSLLSRDELLQGFSENAETYRRLASRLEDIVHFRRATGVEHHARVEDILHHLLTHGYHHRGQLAAHYARSGTPYPSTDHIDFLIQHRL